MKPVAIFFTAGVSDLKFVDDQGRLHELENARGGKEGIRAVHELLLRHEADDPGRVFVWPFDDIPGVAIDFSTQGQNSLRITAPDALRLLQELPSGAPIHLASDKFRTLSDTLSREKPDVRRVVAFASARDTTFVREPVASERLIFNRLRRFLKNKNTDERHAIFSEFLKDKEEVEGDMIKAEVQARIEEAIIRARPAAGEPGLEPWISLTGGIPSIKQIVRAGVELHFGPSRSLERTERVVQITYERQPHEDFVARRHALALVRRGAFNEAAAIGWHLRSDPGSARWIDALNGSARLFDDNPVRQLADGQYPASANIVGLETKIPPAFLVDLARRVCGDSVARERPSGFFSLLVGLRLEAALRTGRTLEAINQTFTFLDVSLKESLEKKGIARFFGERIEMLLTPDDPRFRILCTNHLQRNATACFTQSAKGSWSYRSSYVSAETACRALRGPIDKLFRQMRDAREFRNLNAHGVLSARKLAQAEQAFEKVWKRRAGGVASALDSPLFSNVINDLAGEPLTNSLDRLIGRLEDLLLGLPETDSVG